MIFSETIFLEYFLNGFKWPFATFLISTCTYVNNIRYFSQEYLPELWKYRKTKQTHLNKTMMNGNAP